MKDRRLCLRLLTLICTGFLILTSNMTPARADSGAQAEKFAVLPDGATGPEGITVGPDGKVYVTTFGFNAAGPVSGLGQLYVFDKNGHLLRQVSVIGSTSHLLGLAFHPSTNALLIIDHGGGKVLNVDPASGASSTFMTVTGAAGLNAMTFDAAGNVYVSDSFQGIVWKTTASGGAGTAWVTDALLTTSGVPPFGANGLGFNKGGNALFVANTGNDQIIKIPVSSGTPGAPAVFVNGINGADGIILDDNDNIWAAANQADEIVVIDSTGKLIGKLGGFEGVSKNGVPQGLLFPASLAFSSKKNHHSPSSGGDNRHDLYVTNLALDLRLFGLVQSVDSQWAASVKRYTISKIKARLPSLH